MEKEASIINSSSLAVQGLRLHAFQCWGQGFDPWSGNYDPTCSTAKIKYVIFKNNDSSFWNVQILGQPGENRVTLIFFLGGVTFAEIAALRFLSQLEDGGTEYVIATTKLINGASWIESLMEKPF